MSVETIETLKTYFETGDFPTQQQFVNLFDSLRGQTFKRYIALLSQSGSDAPVTVVLENTLGETGTWTRTGSGIYRITLTQTLFQPNKVAVFMGTLTTQPVFFLVTRPSTQLITLQTLDSGFSNADDLLTSTPIEIRVYP